MAALVAEAQVAHMQHAHAQRHLGADGIQTRVEGFFGDREIGHAHRHHALAAPDEQAQRRDGGRDLQRAKVGHLVVADERRAVGIDDGLERRELGVNAGVARLGMVVGKFELIGGVEFGVQLDRLGRRTLQAQRLGHRAAAIRRLRLQRAGQRLGVVLQRDDALHGAAGRIDEDDAAAQQAGSEGAAHG
ncbi:hypothetical protein D3C85_775760 [compost metagenome]